MLHLLYIVLDLPTTARPIRVMSIQDLYIMRVYELAKYEQNFHKIMTKLWTYFLKISKSKKEKETAKDAKIGDVSFILYALCWISILFI